jgi:protein ImuB
MLWLALHLPRLPLDLVCRRLPEPLRGKLPQAVVQDRRIGWANACARQMGIAPGMPESSARARAAELIICERDNRSETAAMIEAALWALNFTPQVSLLANGLLLNIGASLRLFGGKEALTKQLRHGVAEMGLTPQMAVAPAASAAHLLARHADGREADVGSLAALLDELPVWLLDSLQSSLPILDTIGCETLGHLRRLPRAGIARRFGSAVLKELDRAYGLEPEAHAWYQPPPSFNVEMELPSRAETTDALLFAARRLLMQLSGWLNARHCAVTRFSLRLHHEMLKKGPRAVTTVAVAFGKPSRDLAHLSLLLHERLAQTSLPASVIALSLQADQVEPLAAPNTELFPTPAAHAESTTRLIERLASRLGHAAINRVVAVDDHRPEKASVMMSACVEDDARHRRFEVEQDPFRSRPSWLLAKPLPLVVRQHRPFYQSPLVMLAGPERIESGWWDDAPVIRDYFIARNEFHLLLWIFRQRPNAHGADEGWFLHGFFA